MTKTDPLKAAFDAQSLKLPEVDHAFTVMVLARIEKARMVRSLIDMSLATFGIILILAALAPTITPLISQIDIATWGITITGLTALIGFYFVNQRLDITGRLLA